MRVHEESESPESSEAALAFICKRLHLNYTKLTDEEKKWLARTAERSDLLKNPQSAEGKRKQGR